MKRVKTIVAQDAKYKVTLHVTYESIGYFAADENERNVQRLLDELHSALMRRAFYASEIKIK